MRELTKTEIEQGATGSAVVGFAAIGAASFGGVAALAAGSVAVGQWLNDNTPIQSWISNGIDALTGGGGGGGGGGRFIYENRSD